MDKLKQIIQSKQHQKDPYWLSLYETDIRNLFPKYELAKIDKAKTKYDKIRLIMENIQDFLYIQKYRKQTKRLTEQIDNIKQEIEELEKEDNSHHYNIDIIKQRDHADTLCQQIIKYGNNKLNKINNKNHVLGESIQRSEKWVNYFNVNCIKGEQVSKDHIFVEKVQLAETVQIPNSYVQLNDSTASEILMNRFKERQIRRKLQQKWMNNRNGSKGGKQIQTEVEIDREILSDWKTKTKDINFNQYV